MDSNLSKGLIWIIFIFLLTSLSNKSKRRLIFSLKISLKKKYLIFEEDNSSKLISVIWGLSLLVSIRIDNDKLKHLQINSKSNEYIFGFLPSEKERFKRRLSYIIFSRLYELSSFGIFSLFWFWFWFWFWIISIFWLKLLLLLLSKFIFSLLLFFVSFLLFWIFILLSFFSSFCSLLLIFFLLLFSSFFIILLFEILSDFSLNLICFFSS